MIISHFVSARSPNRDHKIYCLVGFYKKEIWKVEMRLFFDFRVSFFNVKEKISNNHVKW